MEYTKTNNELRSVFDPDKTEIKIPGSDIRILNSEFISDSVPNVFFNKNDVSVSENIRFHILYLYQLTATAKRSSYYFMG